MHELAGGGPVTAERRNTRVFNQLAYLSVLATEPSASRRTVAVLCCEDRPWTIAEVAKGRIAWPAGVKWDLLGLAHLVPPPLAHQPRLDPPPTGRLKMDMIILRNKVGQIKFTSKASVEGWERPSSSSNVSDCLEVWSYYRVILFRVQIFSTVT